MSRRCGRELGYAIGVVRPVSIRLETFGTGALADERLLAAVDAVADLRSAAIIERLGLSASIYRRTAAFGHFGRPGFDLPWERTDLVEALLERTAH